MYIEPNSMIKLYKNVPLDNTYEHTLYFNSLQAQNNYFHGTSSILVQSFARNSYQRVNKGSMRVEASADSLYNCNYLAFQNTNYGSKWFYAFVTSVEYVNNATAEITYEIDVMQTWFFDVTLRESFVEREHASTDIAGDNIVEEHLDIGDYYYGYSKLSGLFNDYRYVAVMPYKFFGSTVYQDFAVVKSVTKNPTALHHYLFTGDSQEESGNHLSATLATLNLDGETANNILCIYMLPSGFVGDIQPSESEYYPGYAGDLPSDTLIKSVTYLDSKPTTLGSYTPRNKKLLTYPYHKFTIETFTGTSNDYAYEYFATDKIIFNVYGNLMANPSFKCVPSYYKGQDLNYSEGAVIGGLPLVSFSTDAYRAWFAQNRFRQGLSMATGMLTNKNALGDIVAGSQRLTPTKQVLSKAGAKQIAKGVSESVGGASSIAGVLADNMGARHLGANIQGSADGSLEVAMGTNDFMYIEKYITPQMAKVIDDYFDRFGYATNQLKTPNRNVRKQWTYTKTLGCNLVGNAPADDVKTICSIYDKGITFWRNPSNVGNYSLDNSIG